MWKVEVSVYNAKIKEYFNSRSLAINFCESWKGVNADIILEDLTPVDGDITDGEIVIIQKASAYPRKIR